MVATTDSPGTEFKVAVAGPAGHACDRARLRGIGIAVAGGDGVLEGDAGRATTPTSPARSAMLAWLASINALVLVFNLIPAFPLDGGRIARAIAWRITGDRGRATRFAATLGQGFSYLFIARRPAAGARRRRRRRDLARR